MFYRLFKRDNLNKLWILLRDHRLNQITNTLLFVYHAIRRFPVSKLPYDPLWLILFITPRCNFRCLQCPFISPNTTRFRHLPRDMTMDLFCAILDRFPKTISIVLAGGEPLLHPDIFDMVHEAHRRHIKVHVNTNGSEIAKKMGTLMQAPLEFINISFYGSNSKTFTQVTGAKGELFSQITASVKKILQNRKKHGYPRIVSASYICTKENLNEVLNIIELCEALGVDQIKLRNLQSWKIPDYDDNSCLYEDERETKSFFNLLRDMTFGIPVLLPKLYHRRSPPSQGCDLPFRQLTIDGDGFIARCCVEGTHSVFENFFQTTDLWNGKTMTSIRQDLQNSKSSLPHLCYHCEELLEG